jgi:hypothetical protein
MGVIIVFLKKFSALAFFTKKASIISDNILVKKTTVQHIRFKYGYLFRHLAIYRKVISLIVRAIHTKMSKANSIAKESNRTKGFKTKS